jgi:hypothetical protein
MTGAADMQCTIDIRTQTEKRTNTAHGDRQRGRQLTGTEVGRGAADPSQAATERRHQELQMTVDSGGQQQ